MPSTTILTADGKDGGKVDLAESLFGAPVNEALIHQAVLRQMAGRRLGTSNTLTRGEVNGGGKKPWRQKGTGRARQGTKTAPHWKGGGVVFGPHPRSYEQRLPSKMRRSALSGVLTAKQADGALRVVEGFDIDEVKTKTMLTRLAGWNAEGKVLLVLPKRDEKVELSCRNLREVRVLLADSLNVVDLLEADHRVPEDGEDGVEDERDDRVREPEEVPDDGDHHEHADGRDGLSGVRHAQRDRFDPAGPGAGEDDPQGDRDREHQERRHDRQVDVAHQLLDEPALVDDPGFARRQLGARDPGVETEQDRAERQRRAEVARDADPGQVAVAAGRDVGCLGRAVGLDLRRCGLGAHAVAFTSLGASAASSAARSWRMVSMMRSMSSTPW